MNNVSVCASWLIHQEGFMSFLQKRTRSLTTSTYAVVTFMGNVLYSLVLLLHEQKLMKQLTQMGVLCSVLFSKNLSASCRNGRKEGCIIHSLCVEKKKERKVIINIKKIIFLNVLFYFFICIYIYFVCLCCFFVLLFWTPDLRFPFPSSSGRLFSAHTLTNSQVRCKQVRGGGNLSFPLSH